MTTGNLWGTTTPTDVNIDNGPEVWLGTVLTFSVSGWVTKARFYKGSSNTGTHVARLWRMSDGAVLGSVTFSGETSSGWQEQAFASAIPVASGTQYCIGYHSPTGFFSRNANYFGAAAFTNGQITGLQSASVTPGVSGNGRYREDTAASTALLDSAFNHTAYFADVEFTDTDPAPTPALAPLGWFSADLLAGSWFAPDLYLAGWGDDEAVNTVTGPLTAPVDPAALALTGETLTAAGTGAANTTPDPATTILTGQTPTAAGSSPATATPDIAALTLTGISATAAGSASAPVGVDVAPFQLAGEVPAAAGTGTATHPADPAPLTLAAQTPAAAGTGAAASSPDVATLLLSGQTSGLAGAGAATAAVDPATLLLEGVTITVDGGAILADVDPAILNLTGLTPAATGTGQAQPAADTALLTLTGITPAMTGSAAASLTIEAATLSLAGLSPAALGSGASVVVAETAILALSGATPAVTGTGQAQLVAEAAVLVLEGGEVVQADTVLPDAYPTKLTLRDHGHTITVYAGGHRTAAASPPARTTVRTSTSTTAREDR